ncbi:MAG TPA: hypothetical protein OIM45_05010 [Clostridiaceae bacterium]|nr:hypothetical protein [Clostridiaceae bacterium]
MFNNLKTIREQNKKIKNLEELVSEHNTEWSVLYAENKQLRIENEELKFNKDIAERRNVEYARMVKAIADELNTNQYNSVENLTNKIKSMLCVGKHF